jgi:hypothetical protein
MRDRRIPDEALALLEAIAAGLRKELGVAIED